MASHSTTGTVRDATYALLRELGINKIFGNPGSTELPMFRDFPEDFEYVLALQESVAVGMADGYAQATRNAALINLHSAAGVGHALGNVFTAFRNQTPLIVTAGQQARSILLYEPFLFAEQATEFPKPYVKWSVEPARAQDVPQAIARAYYIAMQPPQGPVFVSVPVDDWDQPCEPIVARTVSQVVEGDGRLLDQVAQGLAVARKPVFVVGAGIARDKAWAEIVALAERHNALVWTAPMSARNSFPEDHPLYAGFLSASREAIVDSLNGSDFVLVIGGPLSTYHMEGFGPHVPDGAQVYQLVDNPNSAAWAPVGVSIVSDTRSGLAALLKGPAPQRPRPRGRAPRPRLSGEILNDRYLLQQIAALRPKGSIIVEEAPSSRGPMHDHLPILEPDGFYTCASGGLGHGLPAAVGVALGRPGEKVIGVLGDGSSMYSIQGLWTAAQMRLPITFIVIKNGKYEALSQFGRLFGIQQLVGTRLQGMDFVGMAKSLGLCAAATNRTEDLDAALEVAFSAPEPYLLEVTVD